jgi:hypothetical protein
MNQREPKIEMNMPMDTGKKATVYSGSVELLCFGLWPLLTAQSALFLHCTFCWTMSNIRKAWGNLICEGWKDELQRYFGFTRSCQFNERLHLIILHSNEQLK